MDKILHYPKDPKLWELWYISPLGGGGWGSANREPGSYVGVSENRAP